MMPNRLRQVGTVRAGLIAVIGIGSALLGGRVFDTIVWPFFVVVPVAVAFGWSISRLPVAVQVLSALAGALAGAALVGQTTPDAFGSLDPLSGPRRLLTSEWPSPLDRSVIMTIALLIVFPLVISAALAQHRRWHLAILIPPTMTAVALVALSSPAGPAWGAFTVIFSAVLGITATRHRDEPDGDDSVVEDGAVLVSWVAIGVVAAVVGLLVAWQTADRTNPRQLQEANLTLALLDPVEAVTALRAAEPVAELFTVENTSRLLGPELPALWRLNTYSEYDGQRWVPQAQLRPIGGRLGVAGNEEQGFDRLNYDLTVNSSVLPAIPFPGRPLSIDTDVDTDVERTVVRLTEEPVPGTTVRVASEIAPSPADAQLFAVEVVEPDEIASSFREPARAIAGSGTPLQQLRQLEMSMSGDWQLDPDAEGAGQQRALIERFVTKTRRGTQEQFVTAYVLMARALGFDARVALGFDVKTGNAERLTLTSADAIIWPEIHLVGRGWVRFNPVPPSVAGAGDPQPPAPQTQIPAGAQPPIAPPADLSDTEQPADEDTNESAQVGPFRLWAGRVAIAGAVAVVPLLLLAAVIIGFKWRRRQRRERISQADRRVIGVWANATDALVDAGVVIDPAWPDRRIAENGLDRVALQLGPELLRLSRLSSAMAFGPSDGSDRVAADALELSRQVRASITGEMTRWQRVRWLLSLRSIRRSTRSPVRG